MLEVAIAAFNLAIYDGVLPQEEPVTDTNETTQAVATEEANEEPKKVEE
ncbi:hypothetical protein SDC9_137145 [bioreactor metagenome]|uniref:Uncharacterized protein n=1 Tax=bioreactor metagenome TaxID=1076179 RepID=A0A645DL60_9ZZZZ